MAGGGPRGAGASASAAGGEAPKASLPASNMALAHTHREKERGDRESNDPRSSLLYMRHQHPSDAVCLHLFCPLLCGCWRACGPLSCARLALQRPLSPADPCSVRCPQRIRASDRVTCAEDSAHYKALRTAHTTGRGHVRCPQRTARRAGTLWSVPNAHQSPRAPYRHDQTLHSQTDGGLRGERQSLRSPHLELVEPDGRGRIQCVGVARDGPRQIRRARKGARGDGEVR